MSNSVVFPRVQFFANNGRPLVGGRIHTYVAGSSTRARTYKDAAKAQPNANPIILDARGEASVYLADGVEYKFVIEDSTGALIMTQEPVYGAIWPNAAEWPSDATLSYQYMTEARAAASASGPIAFYGTYAAAQDAVGGLPDGGIVEISQDETRAGARTRYKVQGGALVFVVNLDQVRIDLAAPFGADRVGYLPAGTGASATTVQNKLREHVSVKGFGAVGDGVTDDTAAVQAAVTHCFTTGDQLYWPAGTYLTTASISNFHAVRHIGPGVVKRGSALWYIEPQGGQINILNVASSGGSDSNDGLGAGESFEHAQRAVNILETIGPKSTAGRWRIQYGAGTFNESVVSTDIPFFTNYLEFRGQSATVPTWAEGQTVAVGDFRMCRSTMLFMAESEGVTGATEPQNPFGTSSDGGVTWRWIGGHRAWASGQVVSAGEFRTSDTKVYYTIAGGTCGVTAPTHSGTSAVSDGEVLWVFVGHYNAPPTTYPTTIISGALNPALWQTSQVVKAGAARRVDTRCYVAAAAGTCGASTPTHTSGTVSDDGVPWRYIGVQDATLGSNGIWVTPGCRANFLNLQFVNWERTAFGDYAFLFENLGQVLAQFVVARNCSIGPAVINNGSLICQNTIHVNCQNGAWGTYNSKLSLGTSSATSCFVHNCDSGVYVSRSCIAHSDWTTFASNRNGQTISILSRTHSLASNYIKNVKPWWAIGSSEFVNNPTTINGFYWQTSLANTEPGRSDGFSRVDGIHNEECQAEIRYSAFFGSSSFTADAGTAGVSTIVNSASKAIPQDWFVSKTRKIRVVVKGAWAGTAGAKTITASLGATAITGVSSLPNTETGDFIFEAEIVPTGINTQVASYRYTRHANVVRVLNNAARTISVIDANGKNVTQTPRIYATLAAADDSLTLYSVEWFITG